MIARRGKDKEKLESYGEWVARYRVRAGFLLVAVYLIWAQPTPGRLALGSAVALVGLLLRAWSAGCLEKNQQLATGGPYAYTRNPLYLGSALAGFGLAIAGGRWWFLLLLFTFFTTVYWPVMRKEQAHLGRLFPEEFPAYSQAVPMFWPRLRPWAGSVSVVRFNLARYRKNREYRALFGSLVIVLFLCARMYWNSSPPSEGGADFPSGENRGGGGPGGLGRRLPAPASGPAGAAAIRAGGKTPV